MMDGWYDGMGGGGWVLMSLLWIVLVAAMVWAVTRLFPRRDRDDAPTDPKAILDRRLAGGEIDPETYETLRAKLRETRPVGG